jgi:hypothetical protein
MRLTFVYLILRRLFSDMNKNDISGTIPSELGQLQSLTEL